MTWRVPLTDLALSDADVEAFVGRLRAGWLTMGPEVQALEAELAERFGVAQAVAVGAGSLALDLGLRALDVGPGDEVLVPAWCFVAAAHAVRHAGGSPVLVDGASPTDPALSPEVVAAAVTPRTKAAIAVHMLGYPGDVPGLRAACAEHGIALVEDCAQAIDARDAEGAVVGTTSDLGCLSFFSKKQLTCGEGGMVLTRRDDVAEKVRSLRSHAMTTVTWDRHRGYAESYDVVDIGVNARLDEPRAALLRSRLPRLSDEIDARRALARVYRERLEGEPGIELPWGAAAVDGASHFGFAVLVESPERRTHVKASLADAGVQTTAYPALTALTAYADQPAAPNAEGFAERHLVLPMAPTFGEAEADVVVGALREALA